MSYQYYTWTVNRHDPTARRKWKHPDELPQARRQRPAKTLATWLRSLKCPYTGTPA
jgi:hypothetical protein